MVISKEESLGNGLVVTIPGKVQRLSKSYHKIELSRVGSSDPKCEVPKRILYSHGNDIVSTSSAKLEQFIRERY